MKVINWLYLLPVLVLFISDYSFELFESQKEYEKIVSYNPTFPENFYYLSKTTAELIYFSFFLYLLKTYKKQLYLLFIYGAAVFYLVKCTINELCTLIGYEFRAFNNYYSGIEHWTLFVLFIGYLFFVLYHKEKWRWENLQSDVYNSMNVMVAAKKPRRFIEYIGSFFNLTPAGSYIVLYSGYKVGFSAHTHLLQDLPFVLNENYILKNTGVEPEIFISEMKEKVLSRNKFNIFTNNCYSWKFCNIVQLFKV